MLKQMFIGVFAMMVMTTAMVASAADAPAALNFKAKNIDGKEVDLSKYKGRVVLVVNLASRCGLTPQYLQLQGLHAKYNAKGLSVVGFPCNQFGKQEPGSEAEIKEFCTSTYKVEFDLFSKVDVNGDAAHPFYKHITSLKTKPKGAGNVSWNFEKFLLDREGNVIARFEPRTKPDAPEVVKLIEAHLAK
ncbi:MAG: glutathione peroxidase [Planctomycetaceae bacterium]|nr:glutathione peroxidase [Planctomycetaceae bacterium]|tara:strand:- start:7986 stop:8552 length:567 start_codon:yes stop_codon:yes gene_type:complete